MDSHQRMEALSRVSSQQDATTPERGMSQPTQHTPTPWQFRVYATDDDPAMLRSHGLEPVRLLMNNGSARIVDGDGIGIISVDCHAAYKRGEGHKATCEIRDANAAFIVRACNAHDALTARVAELEAALQAIATRAAAGVINPHADLGSIARAALKVSA